MTTTASRVFAAHVRLTFALAAAGMLCVGGLAGAPVALATTTLDDAAAQVPFSLYAPAAAKTFRRNAPIINASQACRPGRFSSLVLLKFVALADVSKRFSLEEGSPQICERAAISARAGTVRIGSRRVAVDVFCGRTCKSVNLKDGVKHGYRIRLRLHHAGRTTAIQFTSKNIALSRAARILSSLRRVNLKRPLLALHSFRTPDKRIWCSIAAPPAAEHEVVCGSLQPDLSAAVDANGVRRLCNSGVQDATTNPSICNQNFDFHAHVMRAGQDDRVSGFRCAATATGVSCANLVTGKGFLIDVASGVVAPH